MIKKDNKKNNRFPLNPGNIFKVAVSGAERPAGLFKIWLQSCDAKVPNVRTLIKWEEQTEPPTASESLFLGAGERVYPVQLHGDSQQQETTPDVISPVKAHSMWAKRKNRGSNQCGPMIPSELWRNDKYSRPSHLTRHVMHTQTHARRHTHFHTLSACPCWLKIQNLIILVNHQLPELTHRGEPYCAYGRTRTHMHTPLPLHIQYTHTHTHTYSYKCSPNSTLSLQLCTGCYEIAAVAET